MKKTIAVIGSAAAFSFAGAGLAAAQDVATDDQGQAPETTTVETTDVEGTDVEGTDGETADALEDADTPAEVSEIAAQLCGTVSAYDFLGSAEGIAPGLSGEECEANADAAVEAAMSGDIGGALDILRGIDAETPDEGEDSGSAEMLGSLTGGGDDAEGGDEGADTEQPAFGS